MTNQKINSVAVIFLTLDRPELTLRCIRQNFFNAGLDADVFLIDNGSTEENFAAYQEAYPHFTKTVHYVKNQGIAKAINKGLRMTGAVVSSVNLKNGDIKLPHYQYDAVVTLANDILMPKDWLLKMVEYADKIPNTGMVGIHTVEGLPDLTTDGVHDADPVFGNVMITRKALEAVGKYNEDFDPYGMQDADYGYRVKQSGFRSYYLPGLKAEHIGNDVGDNSEYRKMKDEGLAKANEIWTAAKAKYDKTKKYKL